MKKHPTKELKFFETKKFKTANKVWKEILEESGFQDCEPAQSTWVDVSIKQEFTIDANLNSYILKCSEYLKVAKFKDNLDRFIFEHHCDGRTEREIVRLLSEIYSQPILSRPLGLKLISQQKINLRLSNILKDAGILPFKFSGKKHESPSTETQTNKTKTILRKK